LQEKIRIEVAAREELAKTYEMSLNNLMNYYSHTNGNVFPD